MTQAALNFGSKQFRCTFGVRRLGAIGMALEEAHVEIVAADNPHSAMVEAIRRINEGKVWEILAAKLPTEVTSS